MQASVMEKYSQPWTRCLEPDDENESQCYGKCREGAVGLKRKRIGEGCWLWQTEKTFRKAREKQKRGRECDQRGRLAWGFSFAGRPHPWRQSENFKLSFTLFWTPKTEVNRAGNQREENEKKKVRTKHTNVLNLSFLITKSVRPHDIPEHGRKTKLTC